MTRWVYVAFFLIFADSLWGQSAGNRFAFVSGISGYDHLPGLQKTLDDSDKITAALQDVGFVVTNANDAVQEDFLSKFNEFVDKISPNDTVLIYYAGHGVQANGINYILPRDFPGAVGDLTKQAVRMDDMIEQVRKRSPKLKIFVFDACQDNPLSSKSKSGLAEMQAGRYGKGTYIEMSTAPNQTALDGVFGPAFAKALGTPGLSISDVFIRVQKAESEESRERQLPYSTSALEELFYFNQNNPAGASIDSGSRNDCTSATVEALRLSLKGHMLDRVSENLRCRPENGNDEQAGLMIAHMFDDSSFPKSREFLEGVWKTPVSASLDVCLFSHQAMHGTTNFDGLAWLFSQTPKGKIQSCDRFDDDLVETLSWVGAQVGKERLTVIVSHLKEAGLSLDHDHYSLFRDAYGAYLGNPSLGFKWVSDSVAPPTLEGFREAKARADALLDSAFPAPAHSDWSDDRPNEESQKRRAEYCPENMSYCSNLVKQPATVKSQRDNSPIRGEFVDRETGLMWTAKASDNTVSWVKAGEYCSSLRQAGYHDWRLPQLEELLKLYDTSQTTVSNCEKRGKGSGRPFTFHIKKGLDPVCGDVWSSKKSARITSLMGYTHEYAWLFSFAEGGPTEEPTDWFASANAYQHHVMCVRSGSH